MLCETFVVQGSEFDEQVFNANRMGASPTLQTVQSLSAGSSY